VSPGDRPDLPLAQEPHLGLRAPLTGTGALGGVQPAAGPFPLEEEPALWPAVDGQAPQALPQVAPRPRAAAVPVRERLPATGSNVTPAAGVLLLLGAALGLRIRRGRP
jgi:LPXTG-motif cell wall-anchored protein